MACAGLDGSLMDAGRKWTHTMLTSYFGATGGITHAGAGIKISQQAECVRGITAQAFYQGSIGGPVAILVSEQYQE